MKAQQHALVLGGLGVIGRNLVEHLASRPDWRVTAVSRRQPDFATPANFISVDLTDADATSRAFRELRDVTHVFFAAYQEQADSTRQVSVNLSMLVNAIRAIDAASDVLQRVILYQGAKYYGAHLGRFTTPARENDSRHMPPNFYYDQQDWLLATAAGRPWEAVILRPDVVCGFAVGNPMNLAMVIAVYASISKRLGLPLRFPGSAVCYGKLAQVTDAGQLAAGSLWAAEHAQAGEAYNLTNGDLFRWQQLWESFARYFRMELAEPQRLRLGEQMADKAPVWDELTRENHLLEIPYAKVASWAFGDFIFGCDWDVISSTTKIRQAGFHPVVDSETMFLRLFEEFRQRRVIP